MFSESRELSGDLQERLRGIADSEGRISARDILQLWLETSCRTDKEPEGGWLMHVYRRLVNGLFPHIPEPADSEEFDDDASTLLGMLRAAYDMERKTCDFDPRRDFAVLSDREIRKNGFTSEYLKLKKFAREYHVYEMMRLGSEITPFNTLGHVAGVHYIAMYVGRQLFKAGVPVDLGLVSAAASSHDIGKYGCRKNEEKKVPYLHYYYTNYCLSSRGMKKIAHIAGNHSVWDLELENLSAESLLLIYADFRSKSTREDGREIIHFYSLREAFDVILNKLDNVDEAKRQRYIRVYTRLRDFEEYMTELGVKTEIEDFADSYPASSCPDPVPVKRDLVLLDGKGVTDQIRYAAVDHNIRVMNIFGSRRRFASLLEDARSETDGRNVRTYIDILREYSTYMTDEQKGLTLKFLYEMLPNNESDIREQTASAMGYIVARYREEYKKELPEDIPAQDDNRSNLSMFRMYIDKFLFPEAKYTDRHRRWIRSSTDFFVRAVTENCRPSCRNRYFDILCRYYDTDGSDGELVTELMSTALLIDKAFCPERFAAAARGCCRREYGRYGVDQDLIINDVMRKFDALTEEEYECRKYGLLGLSRSAPDDEELSGIFLDDLKTHVSWIVKTANISIMSKAVAETGDPGRLLHIATHFANLIKVSETVAVRKTAGRALLQIIGRMSMDQRNEIMVELFNGLEIADYQFSGFIPDYLGIVILHLSPDELDEVITELSKMINTGIERTAVAALSTLAVALENYSMYSFAEPEENRTGRRTRMAGMLMKGMAYYRKAISREAMRVISEHIFAGTSMAEEDKRDICRQIFKRFMTYLPQKDTADILDFYNSAAALRTAYRYLSEREMSHPGEEDGQLRPAAFFPGTFDPFSLGHKAIATTIRDMGFDVYLAIDEFSWSKKTLPHDLRKKILGMSIADEEHISIFPDDISVNIANPDDLGRLRALFAGRELYIAVGSDVVLNATAYKKKPEETSIHTFNHIVFEREAARLDAEGEIYPVSGKVINLTLQKYYEDISSTRIRDNIDLGRDISTLIDPAAQNYIYDKNLYSREPTYKHVLQAREMNIRLLEPAEPLDISRAADELTARGIDTAALQDYLSRTDVRKVSIETGPDGRRLAAFAAAKQIKTHDLIDEFGDIDIASHIRSNSGGEIAVIGTFCISGKNSVSDLGQILLTELLTALLARDYSYAIYHPVCPKSDERRTYTILRKQGFVDISGDPDDPVYAVDMRNPVVIFKDAETVIKAPLNKNPRVRKALDSAHDALLTAFRDMYPGKLILSFNTSAVYSKIVDLVAEANGVSTEPDPLRRRGPYLSVPFGKALSDVAVPNTVTKTLRTEKYFSSSLRSFTVREARHYQSIADQVRTLRSFNRPVILIDDLLHSGQRMHKIDTVLREQDVEIHKVIVGLLTGNALDSMRLRGRDTQAAYFIPSISLWLNERDLYPFIGGDSIDSEGYEKNASINLILPYTTYCFAGDNDPAKIYRFSMTCLENAASIMHVLEREYQNTFEKKLTVRRLGAVITNPRRPLLGAGLEYDMHVAPSVYIENEMRKAQRLSLYRHSSKFGERK